MCLYAGDMKMNKYVEIQKFDFLRNKTVKTFFKSKCFIVLTLLRTPVSAIFVFAPKLTTQLHVSLHCILGQYLPIHHACTSRRAQY